MPVDAHGSGQNPNDHGRLITRFHHALAESRKALGAHAALLPNGRISRFDALLGDFERRRVRIAVYGEVKAGKSTLVNALAGAALSPSSFGPLTSVPIRITYGSQTTWSAGGHSFNSVDELAAAMRSDAAAEEVSVTTDLDLLQLGGQVDLVDTPGVGSEDRYDEISARALQSLDAVVLVVRYPALFTRFTRHLMRSLEGDIGKLFVVWNLDAACHELSEEERAQQIEDMRQKVAGAHELFTVDARRACTAAEAGDDAGLQASGLSDFVAGLGRFATSDGRGATALREAAKRVEKWMRQADEALRKRQTHLEASLAETRRRLEAIQADATAQTDATRAGFASYRATLATAGTELTARGSTAAQAYRKQLRTIRRGWFWKGDPEALAQATQAASDAYADRIDTAIRDATNALYAAAEEFGTRITAAPRERMVPRVDALGPPDRLERATQGRLQRTRRSLRRGWYLPGFEQLYRDTLATEIAAQQQWLEATRRAAEGAAQATLDAKLAEIERTAAAASSQLAQERRRADEEVELESLRRDVPIVSQNRSAIAAMAVEARQMS